MGGMLRGLDLTLKGLGMTDDECCEQIGGGGRAGSIVCCNGRVIPCAWDRDSDPETRALKIRATMAHEISHAKDSRSQCKGSGADGYAGVPEIDASECRAYAAELPWLEKAYDECTTDYCRREFDRQIRFTTAVQPGGAGNFMYNFCNKAGMQPSAEAQRVAARWAKMSRPPPQPPRQLQMPTSTRAKAPTIEYPLGDEYVPPPPPPPPALVAVPGGKPDSSGKCPDGWSYAKLDGQLGCRNNATGTFRSTAGELLSGLDGLGASKKKKPAAKPAPRATGGVARSRMSGQQIAVSIGVPTAIAAAAYAGTKSPLTAAAAGLASYMLVRATQKYLVRPGTIGPRIPGTNEHIINY